MSTLQASVVSADYLGLLVRYVLDAGGVQLVVTQAAGSRIHAPGEGVVLHIPADAWMTF